MNQYVNKEGFVVTAIRFQDDADVISALAEEIFHNQTFSVDYSVNPPVLHQYHGDSPYVHNDAFPNAEFRVPIFTADVGDYIVHTPGGYVRKMDDATFVNEHRLYDPIKDRRGVKMTISLALLNDMLCRELGLAEGSIEIYDIASHGYMQAASLVVTGNIPSFPVVEEGMMFPHAYPTIRNVLVDNGERITSKRVIEGWRIDK